MDKEVKRYFLDQLKMSEEEISISTRNELFDATLKYVGYGNFAGSFIRRWVKNLYGIDLDEVSTEKGNI